MNMSANTSTVPEPKPIATEPRTLVVAKALLMACAVFLYLLPVATGWGLGAGVSAALLAYVAASRLHQRRLRLGAGVLAAIAAGGLGYALSGWVLASDGIVGGLSVPITIRLADVVLFGSLAGAGVFGLRMLTLRVRSLTALESVVVLGSVVWIFAGHQNRAISEPRWFADWAMLRGWSPADVLSVLGLFVATIAVAMMVRRASFRKLALSYLFIIVGGVTLYLLYDDTVIEPEVSSNGLGLTKQEQDKGKGKGNKKDDDKKGDGKDKRRGNSDKNEDGKGGQPDKDDGKDGGASKPPPGDNPYKDSYSNNQPSPVALVVMRDDYDDASQGQVLYFRQRVLSRYAGGRLQPATDGFFDSDVVSEFPRDTPVIAAPSQATEHHLKFPTSMHLMVDHPQPVALTHAEKITLAPNPNPRTFVASYDVESLRLGLQLDRLVGRDSVPTSWDVESREHYTTLPDDPRYEALADIILRDVDPRFYDDDVMKGLLIKRYLEKSGFYTLKETHKGTDDPTASFLFGSLRGYCVHFAHSAVFLMRSQGIAARVALGYAVQTHKRDGGSSMLIMSSDAHAWPEIHVAGVGWVTFDIYPEASDQPMRAPTDRNLESMLGEIARDDKTGGKNPDRSASLEIPWSTIGWALLFTFLALLTFAYTVKVARRLRPSFRGTLDRLADVGLRRRFGESRERFAIRLARQLPTMQALTDAHLRVTLGGHKRPEDLDRVATLARTVSQEYRKNTELWRRAIGVLNPVGWWFTR